MAALPIAALFVYSPRCKAILPKDFTMISRDKIQAVAFEETVGTLRGAGRLIIAIAAIVTAYTTLGGPLPASVEQVDELKRVVWTDKLLAYQSRMDDLQRDIRILEKVNSEPVPPVYWQQKAMLKGQIQRAKRVLEN